MADEYERINWEDSPSTNTPISAENLNKMDKGIKDAHDKLSQLSEDVEALKENGTSSGTVSAEYMDYDLNVKAINHRGYNTTAPENTIPAFILSKKKGFKYVECDVWFTNDGVPVILHDWTINRTARKMDGSQLDSGNVTIGGVTYNELLNYDFGIWKSSNYAGTKIPTFEEFIKLCKNIGLHPYIELKSTGHNETRIQELIGIVNRCGMLRNVSWIAFDSSYLGYVKNNDSNARIGYIVDNITEDVITTINALKSDTNEVFVTAKYSNLTDDTVSLCVDANVPLEMWTVDTESVITSMNPYITGVTSNNLIAGKVLYENNMTYTSPEKPITLTSISATYSGGSVAVWTDVSTLTGIVVTANYSDGTTETVTDYTLSGMIAEGSNTVTVGYEGKTATITVIGYVEGEEEATLSSISATYTGGEIAVGTVLTSLTGITVTGTYSNGTTSEITGYELSGEIVEGENTITVTYSGLATTFTVTGYVENNEPTLLYNWDFTQSLTDTIAGETVVLGYGSAGSSAPTQDENGLLFNGICQYCDIGSLFNRGKTIELDIASFDFQGSTDYHIRILTCPNATSAYNNGFVWRKNTTLGWTAYFNAWASAIFSSASYDMTQPEVISGHTVAFKLDDSGYATMYIDGESLGTSSVSINKDTAWMIGNNGSQLDGAQFFNAVITGMRIYQNV